MTNIESKSSNLTFQKCEKKINEDEG
jgi:hypothetical protein